LSLINQLILNEKGGTNINTDTKNDIIDTGNTISSNDASDTNVNIIIDELHELIKKNLYVTQVVKNYKIMCNLLNQEQKQGKSKILQLKEWSRYIHIEKDKQKFIVMDIYDKPLEKEDKRVLGNNSIYVQHIELLLLSYLSKQKGYTAKLTLKKYLLLLGMVNRKYIEENTKMMKEYNDSITTFQINHFYQRTYQKLREILFSSLNNLKNRRLIDYEELTIISIREPIDDMMETVERIANDTEKNIIRDIEKEVLINMGIESLSLVHLKFKTKEFYNKVNLLLRERYNIYYTYKEIKILFTKKYIDQALQQAELITEKIMLNDKIVTAINDQAEKKKEKSIENYNEQVEEYMNRILGLPSQMSLSKFFKFDDVYIYAQSELTELLIRYHY